MSTLTLSFGTLEVDGTGDFQELLANGFKLVRRTPEVLELETTTRAKVRIRSATPIMVTTEEPS